MSDLISRQAVVDLINRAREEGETDLRQVRSWVESLPAPEDPVAAAAKRLAEKVDRLHVTDSELACLYPDVQRALAEYRAVARGGR